VVLQREYSHMELVERDADFVAASDDEENKSNLESNSDSSFHSCN
jgi:hypothetical protein